MPPESDFWRVVNAVEGQDSVLLMTLLHLGTREARRALNSVMDNRKPAKIIGINVKKAS